ncbi:MAG: hypothetical protein M0Q13_09420 [Methanothrix sp.]|jgi:hypothetical protein|nr:hypothetical protein [Methanothrix sp.]
MPYERVEFSIILPIREDIGKIPEDIKLVKENGVITGLWVIIGDEQGEKIKKSKHFKEIFEESEKQRKIAAEKQRKTTGAPTISAEEEVNQKSKNFINQLEEEIRNYASQKANNFIKQLNFKLDSSTYKVQLTALVILMYQRHLSYGASGYVKSDLKTDIFEIDGEDNLLNRLINNYSNGLEAQKHGDFTSAYKHFYLAFPEKHKITSDDSTNLDLKLLRDGASHNILHSPALQARAKELLGEDFVKIDANGKPYAYADMTNQRHVDLYKKRIPDIKKYARQYIDNYIMSHT